MTIYVLWFIILGAIGGATYVLFHASDWEDLTKFMAFKRIVLGAVVGGLYYGLYSTHNFPNLVMAWVTGYAATDFIEKLVNKMTKKENEK